MRTVESSDLDNRRLTVDRQGQRIGRGTVLTTPKGKGRTVMLTPTMVALLRAHLAQFPTDGLIFATSNGQPLRRDDFHFDAWKPTLKACGMEGRRFVGTRRDHVAAAQST